MVTERTDNKTLALYNVMEIMERAMTPYVLIEDTAIAVYNDQDLPETLMVGIEKKQVMKEFIDVFKAYTNDLRVKNFPGNQLLKLEYTYNGVPIVVKVIKDNPYTKHPDKCYYGVESFFVPNPMSEYVLTLKKEEK